MSLKRQHPQPLDATPPPKRARRFSNDSHNYSPLRPLQPDEKLPIFKDFCYQHKRKDCSTCFDISQLCIINPCTKNSKEINDEDEDNNNIINNNDEKSVKKFFFFIISFLFFSSP